MDFYNSISEDPKFGLWRFLIKFMEIIMEIQKYWFINPIMELRVSVAFIELYK